MARLCLHMIVKNETANIERCLAAAAPHIDCYLICDTGSTDETVNVIRRFFEKQGIPGEVKNTAFRNFGQARNDALEAARAAKLDFDYFLLCDADMELTVANGDFRSRLTAPAYSVIQRSPTGSLEYHNLRIFRKDLPARYVGVTHEYLDVGRVPRPVLDGVRFIDHASGGNRPGKFLRDIQLLTEGLKEEPNNARYAFYLAQSYYDHGDFAAALAAYERRAAMASGWSEEAFYSCYRRGLCLQNLGRHAEMIEQHLKTFDKYPHRAEPLHALALYHQRTGQHRLAYLFAEAGSRVPLPKDGLFVEPDVYAWRCWDIMGVSLFYMGRKPEGRELNKRLLEIVPERERARIFKNLQFCEK